MEKPCCCKGRDATGKEHGSQLLRLTGPEGDLSHGGERISQVDELEQCLAVAGFQALILGKLAAFPIPNTVSISN